MDTFELLINIGYDKKTAAVYDALLEYGPVTLSEISTHTHINRPALYELLPRLEQQGLVTADKKQKRVYYDAAPPERIVAAYQAKQTQVESRLEELQKQYETREHDRPAIKYFEGRKGILYVFDDVAHTLPRGGTFYRYSSRVGANKADFKNTYYAKTRDTKQIERLVITSEEKARKKTKKLERSIKAVPEDFDLFADNISLVIYGNKTAYVDYNSESAFIVESEKIARFQEKLFKLLWQKL